MSRRRPDSLTVLRNGDIIRKSITTHRDGKMSIRRKKIACGVPQAAPVQGAKDPVEVKAVPPTKTAVRKAKKPVVMVSKQPLFRERMHHKTTKFHAGSYIEELKVAYVLTTNQVHRLLRVVGAKNGSHIEQFQRDHELLESALRSVNFEASGGGGSIPIPLARIQAQDRLKMFQESQPKAARVCKALLVEGAKLDKMPVPAKYSRKGGGGRNRMAQDAIDALAEFYTPRVTRPDRSLAEFESWVEQTKRRYESGR